MREERQVSRAQVAEHLRVDEALIMAIEHDDYTRFAAPVFARGHLRGYARFLGVAEQPILAAYDRVGATTPPQLVLRQPGSKTTLKSSDWPVRVVSYLLIASLLVLVYLWWQRHAPSVPRVPSSSAAVAPVLPHAAPAVSLAPAPLNPPQGFQDIETDATASTDMSPAAPPSASPPSAAEALPAPSTLDVPAPAIAASDTLPRGMVPNDLVLSFRDRSWVEVRDAAGRSMLSGLVEAGRRVELDGTPPFRLILGNAAAVQVSYRGQVFDTAGYTKGQVARFSLGP